MGCIIRGNVQLIHADRLNLVADDVFMIPPGVPHTEETEGDADIIWMSIEVVGPDWNHTGTPCGVHNHELTGIIGDMWLFAKIGAIGEIIEDLSLVTSSL